MGNGSSFRETAPGALGSEADFLAGGAAGRGLGLIFCGCGTEGMFSAIGVSFDLAGEEGASVSSRSCVAGPGLSPEADLVSNGRGLAGAFSGESEPDWGATWAGSASREVTCVELCFFSDRADSAATAAAAPRAGRINPLCAFSDKRWEGRVIGGVGALKTDPVFFCGGGGGGEAFTVVVVAAGTGRPVNEADFLGGGGKVGAAGVAEAVGPPKISADFFCGGGSGGAPGVEEAAAGIVKTGAVFFCGGGNGGALGVVEEARAGAPKMAADFFGGGGRAGAPGVAAAGGMKTGAVFLWGGGSGGALALRGGGTAGAPPRGADFFCGGGMGGALGVEKAGGTGAPNIEGDFGAVGVGSAPVFGRGAGKGGSTPVWGLEGGAGGAPRRDPVLGLGGGKGGAGNAPVRGRGKGEVEPSAAVSEGRSVIRTEPVSLWICVGAAGAAGRPGETVRPLSATGGLAKEPEEVRGGCGAAGRGGTLASSGGGVERAGGVARATPARGCVFGRAGGRVWWGTGMKSSFSSVLPVCTKTFAFGLAMKTRGGAPADRAPSAGAAGSGVPGAGLAPSRESLFFCGYGKRGMVFGAGEPTGGADGADPGSVPEVGRVAGIGLVTAVDQAGGTLVGGTGFGPNGKVVAPETGGRGVKGLVGFAGLGGRLIRKVSRLGLFGSGTPEEEGVAGSAIRELFIVISGNVQWGNGIDAVFSHSGRE